MHNNLLTTLGRNDRLAQLWNDLLADPVAPDPAGRLGRAGGFRFGLNNEAGLPLAHDQERLSHLSLETALDSPVLQEAEWTEPVPFTGTVNPGPSRRGWRVDLATWFHSLVELEDGGPAAGEAISESEALSGTYVKAADEETLPYFSPFRWEPKPAWINAPVRSNPPFTNMADPRQFAARPKIPIRPLHKRPFFLRIFFYLRRWLSKSS